MTQGNTNSQQPRGRVVTKQPATNAHAHRHALGLHASQHVALAAVKVCTALQPDDGDGRTYSRIHAADLSSAHSASRGCSTTSSSAATRARGARRHLATHALFWHPSSARAVLCTGFSIVSGLKS